MTAYHVDDRVNWFDPEKQRLIPGTVLFATPRRVLVSLDDRMVPVAAHPADLFPIHPIEAVPA
jgi:hypothetical protein